MARLRGRPLIDDAKIAGLRQALAAGPVRFKNGAEVRRDPDWPADLLVTRVGGEQRRVNEWAHDQLARAYALAIEPPEPKARTVPRETRKQPRPRNWGPCPF